jgi:methylated-DNA-[protein]-cysteine S-methyltransferase
MSSYRIIDSPVGPLLLAATDSGLVRVVFDARGFQTKLDRLAATIGPRVVEMPARLETAASQLGEYFAGSRQSSTWTSTIVCRPASGLPSTAICRGSLRTDPVVQAGRRDGRQLASRPRSRGGCAANPLPIVVPCHRVVRMTAIWAATSAGWRPSARCWSWSGSSARLTSAR